MLTPHSLAVSQTFKIEKAFDGDELGCTQAVHDVAEPLANGLGIEFPANPASVTLPGQSQPSQTYYVISKGGTK